MQCGSKIFSFWYLWIVCMYVYKCSLKIIFIWIAIGSHGEVKTAVLAVKCL